ncbi:hypothetical protein M0Q28_05500 [Patescibacteria group bacterium]|jgi:hypothetical protein|nr:hypothetical protein [Patescibacteria group bacterium]
MTDPLRQCANCFHYKMKLVNVTPEGKCYRYPPKASLVGTPTGPVTATYWPSPKPTEACGEWKIKLQIADSNTN